MELQSHHLIKLRQKFTQKELADIFEVSQMSLWRWENPVNKPLQKRGTKPKINDSNLKALNSYLAKNNTLTQREVANYLSQQTNQPISQQTISRALRKANITHKKLTYQYSERVRHQMAVEVWKFSGMIKKYIWPGTAPNRLLALDECSFHLNEAPRRGYSLKGQRAISQRPGNKGVNYTLILCIQYLASRGVVHYQLIKGGVKAQILHDFLVGINLSSNEKHYLFLDNARVHHAKQACQKLDLPTIKELLVSKNIEPVYSVPYTPELNPVELCFNIIRQSIEKQRPRTVEELKLAIDKAIADLQQQNLLEFFKHAFAKTDCLESIIHLNDDHREEVMAKRAEVFKNFDILNYQKSNI